MNSKRWDISKWNLLEFVIITSQGRGRLYYFLESFHEKAGLWWAVLENHDVLLPNVIPPNITSWCVFSVWRSGEAWRGRSHGISLRIPNVHNNTHTLFIPPPPTHKPSQHFIYLCFLGRGDSVGCSSQLHRNKRAVKLLCLWWDFTPCLLPVNCGRTLWLHQNERPRMSINSNNKHAVIMPFGAYIIWKPGEDTIRIMRDVI